MWPWLTQLGWHLGHTPEWVDRLLFRRTGRVLTTSTPSCNAISRLGHYPRRPAGTAEYVVVEVETPTHVLRSTTHLPPGWREGSVPTSTGHGAFG